MIFNEENSIVLEAAQKMVALGSEAAQLAILGKQSKTQDDKINKIVKLLTVYRRRADLSDDDLESILYDLRALTDASVFPTISPLVGQDLVYLVESESGSGSLIIQNNSTTLPTRSYLNFYTLLQAVDDGTHINVSITPGTDGQVIKMNGSSIEWGTDSAGHSIFNGSDVLALTQRDNLRFYNGLTAADNNPDTDVLWGGTLTADTFIDGTFNVEFGTNTALDYFSVTSNNGFDVLDGTYIQLTGPSGSIGTSTTDTQISFSSNTLTLSSANATFATKGVVVTQAAASSAWIQAFKITPGAHTSLTAATEFVSNDFVGASQQWATGTVATQRFNYFKGFTVTGVSATAVFTNVYTAYFDSSTAGTNATITNNYALGVSGNMNVITGNIYMNPSSAKGIGTQNAQNFLLFSNNNTRITLGITGQQTHASNMTGGGNWLTYNQATATSGVAVGLIWNGASHTGQTAGSEVIDWDLSGLARTITHASNTAITTQRSVWFGGVTHAFASATGTITNAYSVYIEAPSAGTNAAITRAWGLGVAGNTIITGGTVIGASGTALFAATTKLHVKAGGTTTGNFIYIEDSSGSQQVFTMTEQGVFSSIPLNKSSTISPTFTADANSAWGFGLQGTITARSTASDTLTHTYIVPTINTGAATQVLQAVFINATFGGADVATATRYILRLQNGGTDMFGVTHNGIGFYASAPIAQPTTGIAASTFAANTSGIANDTATWDGYTIGQVVKALRNFGLLA